MSPETFLSRIADLMVRQSPASEILSFLSDYDSGLPVAFFLIEDLTWKLAAKSRLSPTAEGKLNGIDPAGLSAEIFNSAAPIRFDGGWARHLCSGAGELLGIVAVFSDCADSPFDTVSANLICSLGTLVVEQANQLGELAFKAVQEAPRGDVPEGEKIDEEVVQEVLQMIARQCPPADILAALCTHVSQSGDERQIAFFLVQGGRWARAGNTVLTPRAESLLAEIDPELVCQQIFDSGADSAGSILLGNSWGRILCSGTGEILGLLIGIGETSHPEGSGARRIESACRLAVLAIEQTNLIEDLAFKADHDPLTGLPNRGYLERALRAAVAMSDRPGRRAGLLSVNLDRFRLVNEVIGLATGNRLLEQVANRLQACVSGGATLARMGADEFAVLLPDIAAPTDPGAVAARLLRALTPSFLVDGHELFVNASVGIACSTGESTPETLEREAYLALCAAKRGGKSRAMHFDSSMAAVSPERLEMEKRLRSAITRGEFVVYYQPQIDFSTGLVSGAEALLRWRTEGLGLVSPTVFVPILEETGLIPEVGRWILRESCRQGKEWLDRDGLRLRIAVNVSALQLLDPDFQRDVERALAETGLPPELLELELTESLFIGEFAPASRALRKLQALGITTALDDFGIGQSSLSYVHRLPFHRLKIDQSFIRGIADTDECPPIIGNIIQMARTLEMSVVAEGVETDHQAELLRIQGCEFGQGFYYSQALPPDQAADFCYKFRAFEPAA